MEILLFGVVNLVASILSGASGGGGGLISTPLMVLLGLTPAQAIATGKFGGLGIALGTSIRFRKEKITDRKTVVLFSLLGAVGAIIGSLLLLKIQEHTALLENLIAITILLVGIPMLYIRKIGLKPRMTPLWMKVIGCLLIIVVVLMQATMSAGVSSLLMIILIFFFGMRALVANATKRAVGLTVAIISLGIFITAAIIDYRFAFVSLFTSFAGGYIGAHVAIKKGDQFILNLFTVVSALLALQLLIN